MQPTGRTEDHDSDAGSEGTEGQAGAPSVVSVSITISGEYPNFYIPELFERVRAITPAEGGGFSFNLDAHTNSRHADGCF